MPVAVALPRAVTGGIVVALVLRIVVEIRRITEGVAIDSGAYLLIGLEALVALLAIFAVSVWLYSRPAYRLLSIVEAAPDELLMLAGFLDASRASLAQLSGRIPSTDTAHFFVVGVSSRGIRLWAGNDPHPVAQVPTAEILDVAVDRTYRNWVEIGVLELHVLDGERQPIILPCVVHTQRLGAFWSLTRREIAGLEHALADVWPRVGDEDTPPR